MGILDSIAPFDDPDDYDVGGRSIANEDRLLMAEWAREKDAPLAQVEMPSRPRRRK